MLNHGWTRLQKEMDQCLILETPSMALLSKSVIHDWIFLSTKKWWKKESSDVKLIKLWQIVK